MSTSSSPTLSPTINNGLSIGDFVCNEGFVMDIFCIERGTLLDNPRVRSLEGPDVHSLHCLVDVGSCVRSGYEMLAPPPPNSNSTTYCRALRLDDAGNEMVIDLARSLGSRRGGCSTCFNQNGLNEGFRAVVQGTIIELGTNETPPILAVSDVLPSENGCPEGQQTIINNNSCIQSAGSMLNVINLHGSLMILSWGILLPSGVLIAKFFRHRPNGLWFKIHRSVQLIGLIFAFVGWFIALTNFHVFDSKGMNSYVHGCLGMTTMCLGIFQPLNAFLRPHLPSPPSTTTDENNKSSMKSIQRRLWEFLHKGIGYSAVMLAIVTISYGTTLVPEVKDQRKFQIAYGVSAGTILLGLIVAMLVDKFFMFHEDEDEEEEKKRRKMDDGDVLVEPEASME